MYIPYDGYYCDVCGESISELEFHHGKAIFSEEGKHAGKKCVEDFRKNSECPEDLSIESIEGYVAEHGTWKEREEKEKDRVIDELLAKADNKRKLE